MRHVTTDCGRFAYVYPRRPPITSRHWPASLHISRTHARRPNTLARDSSLEREPTARPQASFSFVSLSLASRRRGLVLLSPSPTESCFRVSPFPSIRSIYFRLHHQSIGRSSDVHHSVAVFQAPFPSAHWPSSFHRMRTFVFQNGHSVLCV